MVQCSHYPAEAAGRGFAGPGTLARGLPARSGDTMNALTYDGGWPEMGSGRGTILSFGRPRRPRPYLPDVGPPGQGPWPGACRPEAATR